MSIDDEFFSGAKRATGYVEGQPVAPGGQIPPVAPASEAPPIYQMPTHSAEAAVPAVPAPEPAPTPAPPIIRPVPQPVFEDAADVYRREVAAATNRPAPPAKKLFGNKAAQRRYAEQLVEWERQKYREQLLRSHPRKGSSTILVANTKGGVGKTPMVLCLTQALAAARNDGSVAAWEAADEKGTLLDRVGGDPGKGMMALLNDARTLIENPSQVALDMYAAKLSTGARVFGSPNERDLLKAPDIETVHAIISRTYALNVVDTANALRSDAFKETLRLADAVVIPTIVSIDSASRMLKMLEMFRKPDPVGKIPFRPELFSRTVVVITHSIKDVEPRAVQHIVNALTAMGVPFLQVPYDQHIKDGQALEWSQLSDESRQAWSDVAVQVMTTVQSVE